MKTKILILSLFFSIGNLLAQNKIINLWNIIPNSKETSEKELKKEGDLTRIYNVKTPTLEIYRPTKRNTTDKAVIICPGGGYHFIGYDWEGTDMAKWFNSKGITAVILKYRLPTSKSLITPHKAPLQDAQRAIRWVRFNADKLGIHPNKIGVIGYSAGGHVASTLGTQFDSPNEFKEEPMDTISAKPNFMALVYPVITMKSDYTHKGSRNRLIGEKPTNELIKKYSNELQVTEKTPPTFLVHSTDDKAVPVENTLQFYKALKHNNIKVEMHIYPYGKHGYSLATTKKGYLHTWLDRLEDWLRNQ